MKSHAWSLACVLAMLSSAAPALDNTRGNDLIVDAAWLSNHLHDSDLLLLHVGDADLYQRGHIPGARLVSLDDISVSEHTATGLMLEMPTAEDLRSRLQSLGVSNNSRIVVYYGQDWVSPSTRLLFTLQYAGLGERSSLLNGGMGAWTAHGGTLSTEPAATTPGQLSALQIEPLVVDANYVRSALAAPGVAVVDGRAAVYFDGVESGGAHGVAHRPGHIRGAHSFPFTELTDDHLLLRSPTKLRALFEKAGVAPGDTVVGYCHLGQQATAMLFAARLLGHPVLLYDGSFEEWTRDASNPVVNPAAGSTP